MTNSPSRKRRKRNINVLEKENIEFYIGAIKELFICNFDKAKEFIGITSNTFNINKTNNGKFEDHLRRIWKESNIVFSERSKYTRVSEYHIEDAEKQEVDFFTNNSVKTYTISKTVFAATIKMILCDTNWRLEIGHTREIPSTMHRALHALKIDIERLFPNAKLDVLLALPHFMEHTLCLSRVQYQRDFDVTQKKGEESNSSSSIEIDEFNSDISQTSSNSVIEFINRKQIKSILIQDKTDEVICDGVRFQIHPLRLSMVIFCVSNYVQRIMQEEQKVKFLVRDIYLQFTKGIPINEKCKIYIEKYSKAIKYALMKKRTFQTSQEIVNYHRALSVQMNQEGVDFNLVTEVNELLNYFEDGYNLVMRHKSTWNTFVKRRGKIAKIKKKIVQGDSTIIGFDKNEVSCLDLKTSVFMLDILFNKSISKECAIDYNEELNFILIPNHKLKVIQETIVPLLCVTHYNISRTERPALVFPLHTRNFCEGIKGDSDACATKLHFASRSMLRLFERCMPITFSTIPKNKEHGLKLYEILPKILCRFRSRENLQKKFAECYSSKLYMTMRNSKEESFTGFQWDIPNIYTGLKSFLCVYAEKKYVLYNTIERIGEFIFSKSTPSLESQFHLTMINSLLEEPIIVGDYIEISIKEKNDLPMPRSLYLFYLCTDNIISDELAIELFCSINCKVCKEDFLNFSKPHPNGEFINDISGLHSKVVSKFRQTTNNEMPSDDYKVMAILFETLELLSMRPIEYDDKGNNSRSNIDFNIVNPISIEEIQDPNYDKIPIQFDSKTGEPMFYQDVFPIWNSEVYESEEKKSSKRKTFAGELDFMPFIGSHEEFFSCVILFTCNEFNSQ